MNIDDYWGTIIIWRIRGKREMNCKKSLRIGKRPYGHTFMRTLAVILVSAAVLCGCTKDGGAQNGGNNMEAENNAAQENNAEVNAVADAADRVENNPYSTSDSQPELTAEPTQASEPEPTSAEEPEPTKTPAELYQEGVEKSLVSTGNNYRMKRVIEKARNGEDVYMCALGGSVTEGALAKTNDQGYAYLFADEFKSTYCAGDGSNFHFVNAGLSGTPSSLGIIRYQQDVVDLLGAQPDILIIEFAINDYNEATNGKAYESLIRKALEANEDCAVILLYSIAKTGWNMQDNYIKVGKYYSVQQVSIKNGVYAPKNEMRIAQSLYFADDYHPTTYGHRFMKDCMMNLIKVIDEEEPSDKIFVPEKDYKSSDFAGLVMIDSTNTSMPGISVDTGSFSDTDDAVVTMYFTKKASFPNNLYHKAGSENKPFEMKLTCKNILINYKTANNKNFGTAEFYVDGQLVTTADGYSAGGWNNCNVIMLLDEKEAAEHTLTVKLAEGSEDKAFTIFSIGVTQE